MDDSKIIEFTNGSRIEVIHPSEQVHSLKSIYSLEDMTNEELNEFVDTILGINKSDFHEEKENG